MRGAAVLAAVFLAACGGATLTAEGELAAATFLVEAPAADVVVTGNDRFANTGDENRLDILAPGPNAHVVSLYPSTPVPAPFAFVRDPLRAGGVGGILASADRVVAVVFPLIDRTPGGHALVGSLVALDEVGDVVDTDWDDASDDAVASLVRWGSERGLTALETLQLAVRGLGGDEEPSAREAAEFLR